MTKITATIPKELLDRLEGQVTNRLTWDQMIEIALSNWVIDKEGE